MTPARRHDGAALDYPLPDNVDSLKEELSTIWGPTASRGNNTHLGYPREVPIGRCMREGAAAGQPTNPSPEENPRYEALDRAVEKIGERSTIDMLLLRHGRCMRMRHIAKDFRISTQAVHRRLERAYKKILYFLS